MIAIRPTLCAARRLLPGRLVILLPLVLAILAACGPGSGRGPAY
jgi:hypothetical protein